MSAKPAKHDVPILWKRIHPYINAGSAKIIAAAALVAIGGAVIINLPDAPARSSASTNSSDTPNTPAAELPAQQTSAAGDALCEKQAWPYIDQRCREAAQSREGTRSVRVVTDRGASSTAITPIPIVQPKPPAPQPVMAKADTSLGPRVAPSVPEGQQALAAAVESPTPAPRVEPVAAPRIEPVAAKPPAAPRPESLQTTASVQPIRPQPPESKQAVASVQPVRPQPQEQSSISAASSFFTTPAAATESSPVPAEDAATRAKLKAEAKAEKLKAEAARAEQRARLARSLERRGLPPELIAAVEAAAVEQRGGSVNIQGGAVQITPRRARNREAVPEEVLAAVEAAARERRSSGRRISEADGQYVTLGAPGRGERVYLVPRESFGGGW
jgi:hypothetical protein